MTVTAADVAAAIRHERPDTTGRALHYLLYLCQGHHLGWHHQPLFDDTIAAWDQGPVVPDLWDQSAPEPRWADLDNRTLNTVTYVVSRYGNLTTQDLAILTRGQQPWQHANHGRLPHQSARIDHGSLAEFFTDSDRDEDAPPVDSAALAAFLTESARIVREELAHRPIVADNPDRLLAHAKQLRAAGHAAA